MRSSKPNSLPSNESLGMYAGRWVACLDGKIVGHGGTPEQARLAAKSSRPKESPEVFFVYYSQSLKIPVIIDHITQALPPQTRAYLVGGVVRDLLLGKESHDLDLVIDGPVMSISIRLAKELQAAFYPMDPEHEVVRLILSKPGEERFYIDLAAIRGGNLENDLRLRDFTINAMALDIRKSQELLDPLGGGIDLLNKLLRPCSSTSFMDDPIRILRALRQVTELGFKLSPESRSLLRQAIPHLPEVSPERVRDEIFKILQGQHPGVVLRGLDMIGALVYIFPDLADLKGVKQPLPHSDDVWNHTLRVVDRLEVILDLLGGEYNEEKAANLIAGSAVLYLGRYRHQFHSHLSSTLVPERSVRGLLFLAALFHDVGKSKTQVLDEQGEIHFYRHEEIGAEIVLRMAKHLRISNVEALRLQTVVVNHLRPLHLIQSGKHPTRRAIYRFFRDIGIAGVDVCALSLADLWATYGENLPQERWIRLLEVIRGLLEAWWETPHESISPEPLLNGRDLMNYFNLQPGPIIGELLEVVREAQATGQVSTLEQALKLVGKWLNPQS